MTVNGNDYVTLINAADTANIPAGTLRQWIENGRLPATTSDRGRLVRLADVWRLVEPSGASAATTSTVETITPVDVPPPPTPVASVPATQGRRRAVARVGAAYIDKLDELYRAQIAAKSGEIATKDELIVELRRRAERAEQQIAAMERRLAEARPPVIVDQQPQADGAPTRPPALPRTGGLLERLLLWSRQR